MKSLLFLKMRFSAGSVFSLLKLMQKKWNYDALSLENWKEKSHRSIDQASIHVLKTFDLKKILKCSELDVDKKSQCQRDKRWKMLNLALKYEFYNGSCEMATVTKPFYYILLQLFRTCFNLDVKSDKYNLGTKGCKELPLKYDRKGIERQ